ncbi:MAG: HypC/HybG/HupF family hydrogenase formation chaperone [Phycisphaerales bacterium]|nr:MAG: HypC/HybG/HupF family hydrogenase formation chaperone [Phycisphaerales bacterium]
MCLALPAKIDEKNGDDAWVSLGETRMKVNLVMTPEAEAGDWVLVHAGFAIQQVTEEVAKETWQIFSAMTAEEGGSGP